MKQQKIFFIVIIALILGVIAVLLFVKNKVQVGGVAGESSVFLNTNPATAPPTDPTATATI